MKIIVNKDKCIGCNMCEDISEGAIATKFGKDGIADLDPKIDLTNKTVVANCKLAAEACPVRGIKIVE